MTSPILIWGFHPVMHALSSRRNIQCVLLSADQEHRQSIEALCKKRQISIKYSPLKDFKHQMPIHAIHQGIAAWVEPVASGDIHALCPHKGLVLVLDTMSDPHNIGALWRSAAAFKAQSIILTKDQCPAVDGVIEKAACGAASIVPHIRVTNMARCLQLLHQKGFFCVGLSDQAEQALESCDLSPIALVIGHEHKGLRRLTRQHCQQLLSISCSEEFPVLNASVAGAVALHHFYQHTLTANRSKQV